MIGCLDHVSLSVGTGTELDPRKVSKVGFVLLPYRENIEFCFRREIDSQRMNMKQKVQDCKRYLKARELEKRLSVLIYTPLGKLMVFKR